MAKFKPLWTDPPAMVRFGVAFLSVTLSLIIAKYEFHLQAAPVSLFLCAIMFTAWVGGLKAGVLAMVLSLLSFKYYFLAPVHSLALDPAEIPRLVVFTLAALFVVMISAAQKRAEATLRKTGQELQANLEDLHRTQDALYKAQAALTHMTRLTTMGELTASIAHEVNQPLTAVVNNAGACIDLLDPAPDRPGETGPNGASHLEEVREALGEILDESATRLVTIRTDLPQDLPSVSGDRVQLQQVLLNLVMNGMDAMSSVEESKRVLIISGRCETRDGTPEARLCVQDAGVGLKAEERDRLFEAFYTTKPHGMGMGLAISRSIIESHGGRLWAEPNQGPGAAFLFSLPASP